LRQESPALVLFQDDRGNAEALEARTERDAALPAADDDDFRLAHDAEVGFSLAGSFRVRVKRAKRGEERVGAAFSEAQMADRAARGGLEREPGFAFVRRMVRQAPVGRLRSRERCFQRAADFVAAFVRADVPGKRDEVAPVALWHEEIGRGAQVALRERLGERFEPAGGLEVFRRVHRVSLGLGQSAQQLIAIDLQMRGDVVEDSGKRPYFERIMGRNRHVMLRRHIDRQTDVAAGLARDSVSDPRKRLRELGSREIARQLHAAITSSRTKCRRISFGCEPSSK